MQACPSAPPPLFTAVFPPPLIPPVPYLSQCLLAKLPQVPVEQWSERHEWGGIFVNGRRPQDWVAKLVKEGKQRLLGDGAALGPDGEMKEGDDAMPAALSLPLASIAPEG